MEKAKKIAPFPSYCAKKATRNGENAQKGVGGRKVKVQEGQGLAHPRLFPTHHSSLPHENGVRGSLSTLNKSGIVISKSRGG